jgi:hypothetical protein
MTIARRILKRTLGIFLLFAAAACTTSKVNLIPNNSGNVPLAQNEGLVVARVINASPFDRTLNYLTLAPKQLHESESEKWQRLQAVKDFNGNSTLFVAPVKAGEYSLSSVHGYHVEGNFYYQQWMPVAPSFGTIKVVPGEVTNLGTLVYYHKPDGERFSKMLSRFEDLESVSEDITRHEPRLMAMADASNARSWDADELSVEREDVFLNIVQNPVVFNRKFPIAPDKWAFTTKLGVLMTLDAEQGVTLEDVDTLYDLVHFCAVPSGPRLVSDALSRVWLSMSEGAQWQEASLELQEGDTVAGVHVSEDQRLFVVTNGNGTVRIVELFESAPAQTRMVYSKAYNWLANDEFQRREAARIAALSDPGKVNDAERKRSALEGIQALSFQQQLFLLVNEKLHVLDADGEQVQALPFDGKFRSLEPAGWDKLFATWESEWYGSVQHWVSDDVGQSWRRILYKVDRCPQEGIPEGLNEANRNSVRCEGMTGPRWSKHYPLSQPIMFENGRGFSVARRGSNEVASRQNDHYLIETEDGGELWKRSESVLPKYCWRLMHGFDEGEIILNCRYSTGQMYRAHKDALEWELIHEPAPF